MLEQRDAAAASYEQALRLDKNNAAAHFNLGLILQIAGTRERALQQFQRAYELAPDIPDLLKSLTLAHIELERYDEAQALLQAILARTAAAFRGAEMHRTRFAKDAPAAGRAQIL
jgi:Tfp pilus assembly protein PilF